MCPACFANTAMVLAGVGSKGGILVAFVGKVRGLLARAGLGAFHKQGEEINNKG